MDDRRRLGARVERAREAVRPLLPRVGDFASADDFFAACAARLAETGAVLLMDHSVVLRGCFSDEAHDHGEIETCAFTAAPVLVVDGSTVGVFHLMCTEDLCFADIRERAADLIDLSVLDYMAIGEGFRRIEARGGRLQ